MPFRKEGAAVNPPASVGVTRSNVCHRPDDVSCWIRTGTSGSAGRTLPLSVERSAVAFIVTRGATASVVGGDCTPSPATRHWAGAAALAEIEKEPSPAG